MFANRRRAGSGAALVVAPKKLLKTAWGKDAGNYIPDMKVSIAYAENREAAFKVNADIYVINTDGVKWLAKKTPTWFKKTFGVDATMIVDEMTTFKHRTSARSKAMRNVAKHFKFRTGATGTPNSRTITEVWHQVFILDEGHRLGKIFSQFRNAVCEAVPKGNTQYVDWHDKPGAEEAVAALLSDISIRHVFEECMDIPPNHTYAREYALPSKLLSQYNKMADEAILELENDTVAAVNAAVLRNKLLQIASGAVYGNPEDDSSEYVLLDTGRYEFIVDLIEEVKHSVTFFNWRHQRIELEKQLQEREIQYAIIDGTTKDSMLDSIVNQYQAGMFRTILLHPQTGAHGLTLTKGTRTIWSSPTSLPDWLKQGLHRVYRGGQTQKTENVLVTAEGTVEEAIYQTLNDRNQRMKNFLEIIRASREG